MAGWELILIGGASASVAAVFIGLLGIRLHTWLKRVRAAERYEPHVGLSSQHIAWSIDDDDHEGVKRGSASQRQVCQHHKTSRSTDHDVVMFEVDSAPSSRSITCWHRIFLGLEIARGDRDLAYACPRQSPGSRHAFAHRWPRRCTSSSPEKLSSPGFVPGWEDEAVLPVRNSRRHAPSLDTQKPCIAAARYLGNLQEEKVPTSAALYATPPDGTDLCGQNMAVKNAVICNPGVGGYEPSVSHCSVRRFLNENRTASWTLAYLL